MSMLLVEHAARDPRTAADAGLRLARDPLVLVGVNDDGGAVGVEDRERSRRERHSGRHALQRALAVAADLDVRYVAHVERMIGVRIGVAEWAGIEMAAGRGKV